MVANERCYNPLQAMAALHTSLYAFPAYQYLGRVQVWDPSRGMRSAGYPFSRRTIIGTIWHLERERLARDICGKHTQAQCGMRRLKSPCMGERPLSMNVRWPPIQKPAPRHVCSVPRNIALDTHSRRNRFSRSRGHEGGGCVHVPMVRLTSQQRARHYARWVPQVETYLQMRASGR
ncbi:hypothetical protein BD309DRAFT_206453 [Dichomitus squalens]|nr:hypothetical protein BD309DRAFT_206453 [Dichomitus squalens]